MIRILDKGILFGLGAVLLFQRQDFVIPVVVLLTALIFSSFSLYLTDAKILGILWMGYLVLCVIRPRILCFLPLLLYDSMWYSFYWGLAGVLFYYPAREIYTGWMSMLWLLTAFLAVYMAYKSEKNDRLDADIIHLRDTDTELKLVMEQRNRELLEKQDNEIYLATLRERNRIAREIHDNVGHMLSRSILQVGALATICKEETIRQQLAGINDTLNQAMNSIRESVHDLHDDAIDLRQAAYEAVKDMRKNYDVHIEYDMSAHIPRNVKYCFIAIVKEGMSNIIKHSNADKVDIIFREHPGFYQLCIEDNGSVSHSVEESDHGIGISNMRERVEALGGTLNIRQKNGFRIFATVRKEMEETE